MGRDDGHQNEIEHIIATKKFGLTDVAVVPIERSPRTTTDWDLYAWLAGFWNDAAIYLIDGEYDALVEHPRDCTRKAKNFKAIKIHLSQKALEVVRLLEAGRAAGNLELTPELKRLCREAVEETLKREEQPAGAVEAGKSIR
ncbi:hypothetical protein RB195_025211 [Necator americanus]|uniref:Uncharacterized protein n=1 Tax=Necator americanus TaxID=51031 RepID=A0ABR1ERE0_NECAM